ncbi:MAG: SigE family RNA polymerase sigma factor [Tetrasphaera sp.]
MDTLASRRDPARDARSPRGFEDFLAAHGRTLLRLAYVLTGTRPDAEDLLQDTLVDLHRAYAKLSAAEAPYAYARRALVNRHTSNQRKRGAQERPIAPDALPDPGWPDPSERIASDDALWRRLATLPPRMRQVLVLRYYEDLDDAAIADVLGIGVSAVRSTASRAIAILREDESS